MPSVRRLGAHEWRAYRDLRLRALGDSPDAFASTLEAARQRPEGYWVERLASGAASAWDLPLVAEEAGELVGLAWGTIDPAAPGTAHVIQMWVAPESRGRGCGSMLLDAIVAWAGEAQARSVVLSVACGDTPARRLYSRAGFRPVGGPEPLRPGSTPCSPSPCAWTCDTESVKRLHSRRVSRVSREIPPLTLLTLREA
jgi:ribosomal protein S18 acetylase RimI-like enzyme